MEPSGASATARVGERMALASAIAATFLAGLGLLGWVTPWRWLASIHPASIPMAPTTVVGLLLLGGGLVLEARRRLVWVTTAVCLLVLTVGGVRVARSTAGLPLLLDALLVSHPAGPSGAPTGQISPLTSAGLLVASLCLLLIAHASRHRALDAAGGSLALAVCLLGVVVTLGYLYGAPLFYGGPIVPMAFSTGVAVVCLGLALVGLTPRNTSPFRPFLGPSVRARALRAFLPIAPAIVVVEGLLDQVGVLSPAVDVLLTTLLSALVVAVVVSYAAQGVGRELECAEAERERSRREADRLAAIVESSSDAIYALSLDGTIVAWNASATRLFGHTPDDALGRSARILVPPGAEHELTEILERIGAGERIDHRETDRLRKDGAVMRLSLSESPLRDALDHVVGVSVIARDVSEQRRVETALLESEAEFRQLTEAMPQMAWITRPDGCNIYCNQQWINYTGLTLEETAGNGWSKPFLPEDQARASEAWDRASATNGTYQLECRLRRADGVYRWWLIRAVPLRDAAGNILKWFGTATDIHDLKLAVTLQHGAELRLLESEEEYRLLFDSNPHAMWVFDTETLAFLAVNDAAVGLYGFSKDEFLGMTIKDIRPPEELAALLDYLPTMPDSPSLPAIHVKHRRKDGSPLEVEALSNPITFRGRRARLVLAHDVTERKGLEGQLLQAQKMEAVGRLAGGVAHDFNNSLGVILGYTELLMRKANEAQRGKLDQILKAGQRAAGLTRQLLAFSRKEIIEPKIVDLNLLLSDLEKMLPRLIGEHIDVAIVPGAELGQVKADPGQLEQVVMNLCVNARDAMPGGGLLRLETANVELDAAYAARHEGLAPGRYVMLAVSDTGSGIEKETLSKVFEPFFTTKEQGKGTGLGLAMVYGIVKQAGGHVWVYSEVGRGTTFKIYLPRIDDEALAPEAKDAPMPSRGWETILLVEDEESLRAIAREILEEHGYRVLDAANGKGALEISQRHPEPIHLLVTDVVMPGMNGRALAESLVAGRPELRVLYMSGYTDDLIAHSGVLESGTLLIQKPFTARALLERVRAALEARRTGESA